MQGREGRLPAAKQSTSTSMSGARADPAPPSSAESRKRRAAAPPFRPPRRAVAPPFGSLGVHRLARGNLVATHARLLTTLPLTYVVCTFCVQGPYQRYVCAHLAHLSRSTSHVPRPTCTLHIARTLHTPHLSPHLTCTQPCSAWACKGKGKREPCDTRGHSATLCSGGTTPAWTQLPALQP